MTTFNDIFKSGFLSQTGGVTASPFLTIIASVLIVLYAVLIRTVYRKTYRGVMYSRTFGTALSVVVLVTGFVIMTISSNVILSLGMVGALSIVRFRTAVKDAMDVTYMFWAVGLGISAGAGLFAVSGLLFVVVGGFLMFSGKEKFFTQPFLFVFSCRTEDQEREVMKIIETNTRRIRLRSKTVSQDRRELSVEINIDKNRGTDFIGNIASLTGVGNASLISCDGDLMN